MQARSRAPALPKTLTKQGFSHTHGLRVVPKRRSWVPSGAVGATPLWQAPVRQAGHAGFDPGHPLYQILSDLSCIPTRRQRRTASPGVPTQKGPRISGRSMANRARRGLVPASVRTPRRSVVLRQPTDRVGPRRRTGSERPAPERRIHRTVKDVAVDAATSGNDLARADDPPTIPNKRRA